jgi:endoglucanase
MIQKIIKLKLYFSLILLLSYCSKDENNETIDPPITTTSSKLLKANGGNIVDENGNTIFLKGVAFGNDFWFSNISTTHHNEIDFQRVKNMGMNTIRFYLNYNFFEDDANPYNYKQTAWDWLDQNIAWAKKNNIYLVLNMHTPQGGYQSQGNGSALWEVEENQNRLIALWKAIAERYKDEPTIAGFGPLNEPVPTVSKAKWSLLAQKLIDGIREVDEHHLLFIEKAIYIQNSNEGYENLNFPEVEGDNLVYEFHSYEPYLYTHQLFDWANLGDGGKYPDENYVEETPGSWYTATFDNPNINAGTSNWNYFEGVKYAITDSKISYAIPALIGENVDGTVYYDNIVIKEYDENDNYIRDIKDFDFKTQQGWSYWSADDSGAGGFSTSIGYNDQSSIYIKNATVDCNMSGYNYKFIPKQGFKYQISGYMKGNNIANNAACKLRLDFYTTEGSVLTRNKEYLEYTLNNYINWAKTKNVPLFLGEFGLGKHCFENNKGGLQFVDDMLDIILENDLHFIYHAYHEDAFGIYYGHNTLPSISNANTDLINLLSNKLR